MKLRVRWLILAATLAASSLVAGCSGINTTQSVSPATFLLPGLLKVERPRPNPTDPAAVNGHEVAQNQP